ncbi:MAG: Undecaprenyl-phosphate 4-deoxy-4-formamido-L-arabinose transferase [Candidatus Omnitrophica bacterium]|nr:Undecaprenyl-phosphate 4-deoxy-4-formamido-L-arabinose transferase [Candidatus Omnitrophota bacterium]
MFRPRSLNSLTLVFPCYNEEANVGRMIEQAVGVGEGYGVDYEVIVVDDGSADRTAQIARSAADANPRIRLVRHERNQGYGAALRTGLRAATKDFVFLTDGDNQFQLTDIEKLFSKIDGCDAVVGYRISRQDKAHRRFNGAVWTRTVRLIFGLQVRDIDCAFKLFRRRCLQDLQLESEQLLIHAEILARLKKKRCRIEEIGIPHYPRTAGQASATALPKVIKSVGELFRLYWRIR